MTGPHFHITLIRQEESAAVLINGRRSIYTIVLDGFWRDFYQVYIDGVPHPNQFQFQSDAAIACAKLAQAYFKLHRSFPYVD